MTDNNVIQTWKITDSSPLLHNTITFCNDYNNTQILQISKDGIWANPDVPVDEIARKVFEVLEPMIMQAYSLHSYTIEENKRLKEIIDRVKKVCDEELRYVDSLPIREALGKDYG